MNLTMLEEGGMFGLLKPPGMTSHDAVLLVRRRISVRRVGHGGTLDPAAAGVLPVLVGEATKLASLVGLLSKEYRATVVFGVSTDSADLDGAVDELSPGADPCEDQLLAAIARLAGRVNQEPPAYSARRVDGRRLHELARTGHISDEHLRRASREVEVHNVVLISRGPLGWGRYADLPSITLDIRCSPGTYVRQLATRLGAELGIPACLAFLLRRRSAGLGLTDCLTIEELALPWSQRPDRLLAPIWRANAQALSFLPGAVLCSEAAGQIAHGVPVDCARVGGWLEPDRDRAAELAPGAMDRSWVRALSQAGSLLALATQESSTAKPGQTVLRPRRVFAQVAAAWLDHRSGPPPVEGSCA